MFGTLIESMATPQRHPGGSAASLLAHAALIGGAVFATARHTPVQPSPQVDLHPVVFHVTLAPPPEAPRLRQLADAASLPAPSLPALSVPTVIPTSIPPIDFTMPATPADFSERRSHDAGNGCSGICDDHGVPDVAPVWSGNDAIMRLREQVIPPRYPERLRQTGIEGRVVVKFVVDTLGRVDPATIEVIESTHDLFTAAVRESLVKLWFNPAMSGSRKVRATAMMPFEFRLR